MPRVGVVPVRAGEPARVWRIRDKPSGQVARAMRAAMFYRVGVRTESGMPFPDCIIASREGRLGNFPTGPRGEPVRHQPRDTIRSDATRVA